MICLFLEKGIPAQQGEKRLKLFLASHIHEEIPNEESKENAAVPDNVFYTFTEIIEIPLRTLVKTLEAKQELLNKLNQARPDLGLPTDPQLIQLREKSGDDKLT